MNSHIEVCSRGSGRHSGTELLRILAMLFIIASHFSAHSGFDIDRILGNNFFSALFLQISVLGNVGINIFMCIYGYYNIYTEGYSKTVERIIRVSITVLFYSGVIYTIFALFGYASFNSTDIKKAFTPLLHDEYGFPTVYVIVSYISPLINKGIVALSGSKRRMMTAVILLIWSVIPTFSFGRYNYYGTVLGQYILLYLLGGIIRIEFKDNVEKRKYAKCLIIGSAVCIVMITILYDLFPEQLIPIVQSLQVIYSRESFFCIMLACGLVMYFTTTTFRSTLINKLGALTFGIYLIHDNKYIRGLLWTKWLHCAQHELSPMLPIYELGIVTAVFLGCGMIELVRTISMDRMIMKISLKFTGFLKRIYHRVSQRYLSA